MSIPTKRLDALDPTFSPERDHEVAAMRDGISNKLRVEQILALLQSSDIPDAAVTLAKLAADARAAAGHTFDDTTAQLGETNVQGAINVLAMGYRLRGAPIKIEESGTYTPDPEVRAIWVEVQGAGGGGGGASQASSEADIGGGGGAGAYAAKFIENPSAETITIGAGGPGGAIANSGSAGGETSYGTIISCPGGNAGEGTSASTTKVANGGDPTASPTGGDINVPGGAGGYGLKITSARRAPGIGADTKFGAGGRTQGAMATSDVRVGEAAIGYGSGGGGGVSSTSQGQTGGDGGDGVVYIWEFI